MRLDGERVRGRADRLGGELQPTVQAQHSRYAAGRAVVVGQHSHPQRGQHRPGVRGQRDRPADDDPAGVVDEHRHPGRGRRPARRQHQDRQVLVVAFPHLVAPAGPAAQVDQLVPAGPVTGAGGCRGGRGHLGHERPVEGPQRDRLGPGPAAHQLGGDRHPGHRAPAGQHRGPARCTAATLPRKSTYAARSVADSRNRSGCAGAGAARRRHTDRSVTPRPSATSRTSAVVSCPPCCAARS